MSPHFIKMGNRVKITRGEFKGYEQIIKKYFLRVYKIFT